jgi:hypothetical protein
MAVIAIPSALKIRSVSWTFDRPAQVNRSQWTGRDQVIANPWFGRWAAETEIAPVQDADAAALRAFLAQMEGRINTCRLPAVVTEQFGAGFTVTVTGAGAAAGATSVPLTGLPPSTTILAGRMLTINDQLLITTAAMATNGSGAATATVEPPLRAAAPAATAVEARNPTALVALAESSVSWSMDLGPVHGFSLSFEERF